jgi:predicted nucleotidyltransferase
MLDRENILSVLRDHAPELREAGLVHLRVFGSFARNQANDKSDIDLLADFDRSKQITLVTLGSLESRLSMLLGMKVELSSPDWMREPIRARAMQEAVVAF